MRLVPALAVTFAVLATGRAALAAEPRHDGGFAPIPRGSATAGGAPEVSLRSTAPTIAEPPEGWEQPPAPAGASKPKLPACCAYDTTCCSRQVDLDNARRLPLLRTVEVRPD